MHVLFRLNTSFEHLVKYKSNKKFIIIREQNGKYKEIHETKIFNKVHTLKIISNNGSDCGGLQHNMKDYNVVKSYNKAGWLLWHFHIV